MTKEYVAEPFRIKMVEPIKMLTREEREEKIAEADYNLFNLKSEDVYIDLLTDSGTNAMSQEQWAGVMRGDEAYAGGSSYFKLLETARDIFAYQYIQPVHQGRAAEKVLFPVLLGDGKYSISNMHFDTTRAHVELAGARAIDCVVEEASEPELRVPFKGNMDTSKLEKLINKYGSENIGVVVMTITNNSAGGQPVSMENIKETAEICHKYNIHLNIDAARYAENAYFIKQREEGYADKSIKEIVSEMFSYAETFTMSAKKDTIVNMGGLLGVKDDEELFQILKARTISNEGFITYGGLAGRDLESLAIGLKEGIDENYLEYRIGQIEYLAGRLDEAGIA
ncbi:MAG: tryptophanase, partial [Halanaerobium sp. MSAO_Bac5]